MNLIYFYDFETNGFPLWSKPSNDPGQPHIVQCAAVMVDADTRKTISSFDLIARPFNGPGDNSWTIPDDVAKIHGITTEYAMDVGVDECEIAILLMEYHYRVSLRVGHNQPFDARIMRIAIKRYHDAFTEDCADTWKAGESYCTQSKSTPIVKCPPSAKMLAKGRKGNKTCSLGEAYQHFMGRPMENAHTAMGDVLATMAVYWAIQDLEPAQEAPEAKTQGPTGDGGDGVGFL